MSNFSTWRLGKAAYSHSLFFLNLVSFTICFRSHLKLRWNSSAIPKSPNSRKSPKDSYKQQVSHPALSIVINGLPFETRQGAYIARTHPAPLLVKSSETSFSPTKLTAKLTAKPTMLSGYRRTLANNHSTQMGLWRPWASTTVVAKLPQPFLRKCWV